MAGSVLVPLPPPRSTAAFSGDKEGPSCWVLGAGLLSSIEAECVWRPDRTPLRPPPPSPASASTHWPSNKRARVQHRPNSRRRAVKTAGPTVVGPSSGWLPHVQQRHKGTEHLVCPHTWCITGECLWEPLDERGTPKVPSSLGSTILNGPHGSR